MAIELNPLHTLSNYAEQYGVDKRLRLFDIFTPKTAGDIATHIHQDLEFKNAYVDDGEFKLISTEDLQALGTQKQQALTQRIYKQASEGVGFLYSKSDIYDNPTDFTLSQQVWQWLNSKAVLEGIRAMTGIDDINGANAQATRYYPGHFLTRHNDVNDKDNRRVAYVLNFTPKWHPDWGGLLQFYHDNGNPKDTWVPIFNSLALFDVTHPHAVSYVAPFARHPRLAITGWFTAKK
ncbi:2OG-Fe(II) oxygenase family protein [Glaciecola sp. SC05]|uniref:2OG-Fe(II) oxygenase n=1 Tax=Glaciecola sp. SC05 TaxID=1987355 RepID=UPI00352875FE